MKATLKIMALALMVAMAFTACKKEYTITVKVNNPEWGTVTGGGTYPDGEQITIAAIPNSGFYFSSWLDGDRSNPRTLTVTANATYTAVFTDDPNGGGGGGDNPNDPLQMSGTISANVTWPDRGLPVDYIIEGMLGIEGNALLTIDPGVTIMFTGVDGGIYVGENAGLKMVGTATKPIILQGPTNNPNNGSWNRIEIHSSRADNQFEYVQFLRGGSEEVDWLGVVNVYGKLGMKHCVIDGSLCHGLQVESYMTAFEDNIIKNCAMTPFHTYSLLGACKNIGSGNSFIANANNHIFVEGACEVEENLTIKALGIPYYFGGGASFGGSKVLTIEAGAILEVAANSGMDIWGVQVIANGTASAPIIFRAESGAEWDGLTFNSERAGNSFNYCQFQNGGRGEEWFDHSCLYIRGDAHLSLTNCTFGPSLHYGVAIEFIENWGNITHSGCSFNGCQGGNVFLENGGEYNGTEYESGQVLNALP